jgi:Tol biopolymer transport system component
MRGLIFIVVCCVPLALAQASAKSSSLSPNGKIVYSSSAGPNVNNAEIFSIGVDGSRRRDLTRNQADDGDFAWSPTGDRVAFVRANGLYVMRADGSEQRLLTPPDIRAAEPTWSPDGRRLAFSGLRPDPGIWVVGADGAGLTLLAEDARSPVWAPRGSTVAFVRIANSQFLLEVVDADGGAPLRLAGRCLSRPTWSPDASALAYAGGVGNNGDHVLYRVAVGGGTPERLYLDENSGLANPAWSPDGTRIAFAQGGWIKSVDASGGDRKTLALGARPAWSPDGHWIAYATDSAVHVMLAEGRFSTRKVRDERPGRITTGPAWSPDGQTLLFASMNTRNDDEVFVVNPDGSQGRQLTRNTVDDELPAWSPDHTRIAFARKARLTGPSIWVMTASGRHQHRLGLGTHPSWSPNGSQLAFERDGVVYTMSDRGRGVRRITRGTKPVWAPRGRKIAFERGTKIYLANANTGAVRRLADRVSGLACAQYGEGDPAIATLSSPDWSPDASRLAVSLACDYYKSSYVAAKIVSSRGNGVIGDVPINDLVPESRLAWSPDGTRLAFSVAPPGHPYDRTIATAKLDGTSLRTITAGAGLDHDPDW